MKPEPTTNPVLLYGSAVGFIVGILAPMVFGFIVARDITSPLIFSIFAGPFGAIVGAYISVFWKTTGTERKVLADSLFPKLGGVVGVILVFWITAVTVFYTFEDMVPGILYGGCVGGLMTPLGAVGGKYLAKYLMKARLKEEDSD